jgi:hypothetical protein
LEYALKNFKPLGVILKDSLLHPSSDENLRALPLEEAQVDFKLPIAGVANVHYASLVKFFASVRMSAIMSMSLLLPR